MTLPLIIPAIAAGWMLAFTLSLDDVVIASFTTGPGSATLPIRIYSEVRLGVKPEINAICTMVIALDRGGDRGVVRLDCRARRRERCRAVRKRERVAPGAVVMTLRHDFTAPAVSPPTM